jgi:hypothetical protein
MIAIIGIAINALSLLGGGLYALSRLDSRLQLLGSAHENFVERLNKVDLRLEAMSENMITLVKQEERLNSQDLRLQELANRLDTYINPALRKTRKA